eukprot:TRINITY_DN25392_c0_g1_i1.p1 TRINITY_DN25392_c0_g1~~TRINITY_DN25392_c0_g1_i1.p1  ORF type:complete len:138 (-),score=15.17 TRINITY_DN25392_c0_g1_i1:77-490(-)
MQAWFRSLFAATKSPDLRQQILREDNPFNEIQLLTDHSDIVRVMILVSGGRFASCGDDSDINIWSIESGEKLFCLQGHTKPVTCLLELYPTSLVSGSSDKSLRIWNLTSGICTHVIPNSHNSSVKHFPLETRTIEPT